MAQSLCLKLLIPHSLTIIGQYLLLKVLSVCWWCWSFDSNTKSQQKLGYNLHMVPTFGLTVNPTKCQAIVVRSHLLMSRGDTETLVTFIGVAISLWVGKRPRFAPRQHTKQPRTSFKILSEGYWNTSNSRNFLPDKMKTALMQTLIFLLIDYGEAVTDPNVDLLDKLGRLLNNCIWFVKSSVNNPNVFSVRSSVCYQFVYAESYAHVLSHTLP